MCGFSGRLLTSLLSTSVRLERVIFCNPDAGRFAVSRCVEVGGHSCRSRSAWVKADFCAKAVRKSTCGGARSHPADMFAAWLRENGGWKIRANPPLNQNADSRVGHPPDVFAAWLRENGGGKVCANPPLNQKADSRVGHPSVFGWFKGGPPAGFLCEGRKEEYVWRSPESPG